MGGRHLLLFQKQLSSIDPISLVTSGSSRLSLANGIDATHKELNIRRVRHYPITISVLLERSCRGREFESHTGL